jgi:hypothetical protein
MFKKAPLLPLKIATLHNSGGGLVGKRFRPLGVKTEAYLIVAIESNQSSQLLVMARSTADRTKKRLGKRRVCSSGAQGLQPQMKCNASSEP